MQAILSSDVLDLVGRVDLDQLDLARRSLLAVGMDAEAGACADALLTLALLKGLAQGEGQALALLARPIRAVLGPRPVIEIPARDDAATRAAQAVPALRLVAGEGLDP